MQLLPNTKSPTPQLHQWWERFSSHPDAWGHALSALVVLIVTILVSGWVSDAAKRMARRLTPNEADRTLPEFLSQVVRWILLTIGLVVFLNRLGIETTSFITVLGAASLSIGLALQNTLGNTAAGLMILFTKPYRIGDSVTFGETKGRVHRLGIFTTEVDNYDNIRVYVPNAKVFGGEIQNLTTNGALKIDLKVEVGYETDLEKALEVVKAVIAQQPLRLPSHDIWAGYSSFGDSGIVMRVHMWVTPAHVPSARCALIIAIKQAFDAAGIDIPYPHQVAVTKPVKLEAVADPPSPRLRGTSAD
jgi:small conductance mechanosensitive channel